MHVVDLNFIIWPNASNRKSQDHHSQAHNNRDHKDRTWCNLLKQLNKGVTLRWVQNARTELGQQVSEDLLVGPKPSRLKEVKHGS